MDPARLRALGVFDPDAPDADERLALLAQVVGLGAGEDELIEAARAHRLGELALELAVRSPGARVDFATAARDAGLDAASAARFWRAAGFVDPEVVGPSVSPDEVAMLRLMGFARELFGLDAALAMVRAMGSLTARLAETIIDAFRTGVELPRQAAGVPYPEIVETYSALTTQYLPQLGDTMSALLRRHLLVVASASWSADEEVATTRRDLVVGFVDLVGYTEHSGTLTPRRLAALVTRLEDLVSDRAGQHNSRVVKLIGDGAMFVSEQSDDACALALALVDEFAADDDAPPLRAALAAGQVVSVFGDYFGDVVNTAARLLAIAGPSEVIVDESIGEPRGGRFELEPVAVQPLKGLPTPTRLARVRRR